MHLACTDLHQLILGVHQLKLMAVLQANAQDKSLQELITEGRADIATGQATVESLLNKIIGEQNTAAAAEAAAASALAAIESLTTEQQAAAQSIATAYTSSLNSIEASAA